MSPRVRRDASSPPAHLPGIDQARRIGDVLEGQLLGICLLHAAILQHAGMRVEDGVAVRFMQANDRRQPRCVRVADELQAEAAHCAGRGEEAAWAGAFNLALPTQDPTAGFLKCFATDRAPPRGTNFGYYTNPALDAALHEAQEAFAPGALDTAIANVNTLLVDDVPALLVVHDLNPRALAPAVKGFVQP